MGEFFYARQDVKAGESITVCFTHKWNGKGECPGCVVDASFLKDNERAQLRMANTSSAIRARALAGIQQSNGHT